MAEDGVDPRRVAELLVSMVGGERRGSGYLVDARTVLTAAHVVRGAVSVVVRFDGGTARERRAPAEQVLVADDDDFGVVLLSAGWVGAGVEPVRFGRLADRAAVVPCRAVGFPRFKLRTVDSGLGGGSAGAARRFRDRVQADGRIAVLSNSKEGTLEVITDPPVDDVDGDHSPWEGMSGAAVWVGDRIVAVVSKHHRSDSPARLAAARVDRWLHRCAEVPADPVRAALGLPASVWELSDVLPRRPDEQLAIGYLDQVRDILPLGRLLGRDAELAELVAFCAGDQPYAWWQAVPWAGKSALAAWLVLHPPAGIEVVSFFITSRWAGQADSDAFTTEMIKQLARTAGEPEPTATTAADRHQAVRYLLRAAAEKVAGRQRRLLLVVDGLDEDQSTRHPTQQAVLPSIAGMLPIRPPDAVRVVVTSRPHPGLPEDVRPEHPLRSCHVRQLSPSPHAAALEQLAKAELKQRRAGGVARHVDVLGYLTAAGGGLTRADLAHLAGVPGWELEDLFGSVFGRTLRGRTSRTLGRVYLFAHETLRVEAQRLFRDDLPRYWQRIRSWADVYRVRGWPEETPGYLLAPYGRQLVALGETHAAVAIAVDPARQDRLYENDRSDAAALAEILASRNALMAQQPSDVDLVALATLAIAERRLRDRNTNKPPALPLVWARLGDVDHAEQIARTITDPDRQARALVGLAQALAGTDPERAGQLATTAEQIARTITHPERQDWALVRLAEALAGTDRTRAEQIARTITDPDRQAATVVGLVKLLAGTDPERAEQIARTITDPYWQAWALGRLAQALAGGAPERAGRLATTAEQIACAITDPDQQAGVLVGLVQALAGVDPERAGRLASTAERIAHTITDPDQQAGVLVGLVQALAGVDPERAGRLASTAEQIAHTITDPHQQAGVLVGLAEALAGADPERAEQIARTITDPDLEVLGFPLLQVGALVGLAKALAGTDPTRAEQIARTITSPHEQAWALGELAQALADTDPERVAQIARTITDPYRQVQALIGLAQALAGTDPERAGRFATTAEQIARTITDPGQQAGLLAELAQALTGADPERAGRLATRAEQIARTVTDASQRVRAMVGLAQALAGADAERAGRLATTAEPIARTITNPYQQAGALAGLALALAGTDPERAEQIAHTITDPYRQVGALGGLARALAGADPERAGRLASTAEQVARTITDPHRQVGALGGLARALAGADPERAGRLATTAEQVARTITDPDQLVETLTGLAHVLASAAPERAEQISHTITDPHRQVETLGWLAQALASTDPERAGRLATTAEYIARTITHPYRQAFALVELAEKLAGTNPERASQLATAAEPIARTFTGPRLAWALRGLALALAGADPERAEQNARSITDPSSQASALGELALALAGTDPERAAQIAHTITDPNQQVEALARLTKALAGTDPSHARRVLAHVLTSPLAADHLDVVAVVDVAAAARIADYLLDQTQITELHPDPSP